MIKALDRREILRYLGYPAGQAADPETEELITQCEAALLDALRPKWTAGRFPLRRAGGRLWLGESQLELPGTAIRRHLQDCGECVLFAATLGMEADRLIRQAQLASMTRGIVMDACATAFIEAVCDHAETELNARYGPCSYRFSPGYGDLPITLQRRLLTLLDAERKIGLHTTDESLLIPGKSVTAILGLTQAGPRPKSKCDICQNKERCEFCRHGK